MRKLIVFIVSLILVVSFLSSCSEKGTALVPSGTGADGRFIYTVTYNSDGFEETETVAKNIRSALKEGLGYNVTIIRDYAKEDFDGNYEILVGATNREESAEAKNRLKANRENNVNDFIVAVIDDKIVIEAINPHMLSIAGEWLINNFCNSEKEWLQLKDGYQFIYEHEKAVKTSSNIVAGKDLGEFTVVIPAKCSYLVGMYSEKIRDFYKKYGISIKTAEDVDPKTQNEIIIGDTSREESKSVFVDGDNYEIKVVNGNVVIKGGNDLALWRGAKAFLDEISKIDIGTGIDWAEGYSIKGKYDANEEGAFTLNWNDEFEQSTVDFNKWGAYAGMAGQCERSSLGGIKWWQTPYGDTPYPNPENLKKLIYTSDGNLHIGTQRLNDVDFVGGQISTDYTMVFRYGIFEIRSKLPPEPCSLGYWLNHSGLNSATESIAKRFGGAEQARICAAEIDIIENFGSSVSFNTNIHRWWTNNGEDFNKTFRGHDSLDDGKYTAATGTDRSVNYNTERYGGNLSTDYHYYGVYWTEDAMNFTFDGKVYFSLEFNAEPMGLAPYRLMSYFITECQMGDRSYGKLYNPETDDDYYEHVIDYVRIYQTASTDSQLITAWPQKVDSGEMTVYYPENPISLYD